MSDQWFSSKLAPDGSTEDGCHPDEAQALKDYLNKTTTAPEAAKAITHPITTSSNPREDLPRLWAFLMDALIELPSEHIDPLISLLRAIEALPSPDFNALEEGNRQSEKLWKGLPGFGHLWADSYQSGSWRKAAAKTVSPERDTLRTQHIRKAHIEARLCMAGLAGIPIDWGYEVVADALESSNALLDFEVSAAAEWIVVCGERFREGAERGERSWGLKAHVTKSVSAPARDLWKEGKEGEGDVMSVERWGFWQKRLEELQVQLGVAKNAAERARRAVEC